jgi:hypothetical protein
MPGPGPKKSIVPPTNVLKRKVKLVLGPGQTHSDYGFDLRPSTPKDSHKNGLFDQHCRHIHTT